MTKLLRDKWNIDSILKRKIGNEKIAHFGLSEKQRACKRWHEGGLNVAGKRRIMC